MKKDYEQPTVELVKFEATDAVMNLDPGMPGFSDPAGDVEDF